MKKLILVLSVFIGSIASAAAFSEADSNSLFGVLSGSDNTSIVGNHEEAVLVDVVCSWDRLLEKNSCVAKKDGQAVAFSDADSDRIMDILNRVIGTNEVGAIANRAISLKELSCEKQNGETVAVCTYKK